MKYAEYKIEDKTVTVYNSILGVESVDVNGTKVSKGFSLFGRDHFFMVNQDKYRITPRMSINNFTGVAISIYKNGNRVSIPNQISKKDNAKLIGKLIAGISLGLIIGFNLGKVLAWILKNLIN